MGAPCRKHAKPSFGCPACIEAARSEHRTLGAIGRGGRPIVKKATENWECPLCHKQNHYSRFVCLGHGGKMPGEQTMRAVVVCGYDRRSGNVPDRLLRMVEGSKGKK